MDEPDVLVGRLSERSEASLPGTLRLGRVAGIEIGVHYTWLFAFALVTYSLAVGFFPQLLPGRPSATYWLAGGAATLLLFASVLVHELAHSLVARARGLPVRSIVLFIFGGASNIGEEAGRPRDEFLVAAVGPASSLVLAGLAWLGFLASPPGLGIWRAVLFYLALVNLTLAIFNLLPGFPLDGGRVLRAVLWATTGSLRRATVWAAGAGQILAFALIAWGAVEIVGGNLLGGIWIAFVGWFLNGAAESSRQQTLLGETVRGVRVRDLMTPEPPVVAPTLPLRSLVEDYAVRRGARALLVAVDGRLAGIVTLADLRKLPPEDWGEATVAAIMTRPPLVTVAPEAELPAALRLMGERDLNQLPVVADGTLVGLLTRANVLRYFQVREELGQPLPAAVRPGESAEDQERRAA